MMATIFLRPGAGAGAAGAAPVAGAVWAPAAITRKRQKNAVKRRNFRMVESPFKDVKTKV
jgi:hypothetical protein